MSYSFAIQNSYQSLQIALFNNQNCLEIIEIDKKDASKNIILIFEKLLKTNKCLLSQIDYITVNQGPGPFTTLRVVIASVNGISFGSKIPLIGINSLDALLDEFPSEYTSVALLNAFTHSVYFALRSNIEYGCKSANELISELCLKTNESFYFIGNGSILYKSMIETALGNRAHFPAIIPETCSIQKIGQLGFEKWQKKESLSNQLQPFYFKSFPSAF
jgi:tRNA threonylcarbamoyladenosine biosynthesis protein TsaB